jgi:hypothetical protein
MKLDTPKNSNYCATVVKIKSIIDLPNCDNVVATPIFGFQAIVNKTTKVGDLGIVFPVETQLSEDYAAYNSLYRHVDKNSDPKQAGYLEDNRRIRAVKFRGHRSDCLFMPLTSVVFTGVDIKDLKEGDEFDVLNGYEICNKYTVPVKEFRGQKPIDRGFQRVEPKHLPEHLDSSNFFKFSDQISKDTDIIVTQKLHGTSIRIANTIVSRKPTLIDRIAKFFRAHIQQTEFDYVFGSRKVIKDVNNPHQNHFYEEDIWSHEGAKLQGILPQNYIAYGELIGWTSINTPIQKNYTYKIPQGKCELYIYRIAIVNAQGVITDLSWDQVKEFCISYGLKHVPELWRGKMKKFDATKYLDIRFADSYKNCLELDDPKLVDEGVCVRVDKLTPLILKAKSPIFLQHETALLDKGELDIESEEAITS